MSDLEPQLEPASVQIPPHLSLYQQPLVRVGGVFAIIFVGFLILLGISYQGNPYPVPSRQVMIMAGLCGVVSLYLVLSPGVFHFLARQPMKRLQMQLYSWTAGATILAAPMMAAALAMGSAFTPSPLDLILIVGMVSALLQIPLVIVCLILSWRAFKANRLRRATFMMALPVLINPLFVFLTMIIGSIK